MAVIRNPIIPGFYPDPSICRVGGDFYIACSSFELWPGVPIFHSRDLAHWELIGHAVSGDNGFHVEANSCMGGVMAPTIRYHEGTFYIINANFSDRGNYIVTAPDPAGPWSAVHYLDDVPGIDASIFFDDDGECYVCGTGNVWDNGAGCMERGIWIARYDIEHFKMAGKPFTIWNSALRGAASPEAPHLYHIGDYYYLLIAEGGTEHYHAVTVARSRELFAFFEGNPANPVLTHRHMGFRCPITNVGHADLVELPDGSWYAVMLASRLIDGGCKNLGRETFLCPVVWERGWPVFAPETGKVEWEYEMPACLAGDGVAASAGGVRIMGEPARDEFDDDRLPPYFVHWGTPYERYYEVADSALWLRCISQRLDGEVRPMCFGAERVRTDFTAFVARRQRQPRAAAACRMRFLPRGTESAGLAVVQAMNHQLHVERCVSGGRQVLRAVVVTADYEVPPYFPGFACETRREVIAEVNYEAEAVVLRIVMDGEDFRIFYGASEGAMAELCSFDGHRINPEKVGCMAGTTVGMYATGNGTASENSAAFDFFELVQ